MTLKAIHYDYLAIATLSIGVVNLCAWFLPVCGLPLSLVGLALGVISRNSSKRSLALLGMALCGLGLALSVGNALYGAYLGLTGQL